jgi:hypothetical protein
MGQFGNQPDFGTRAVNITPTGDPDPEENVAGENLGSAALYIGTGGTLVATVIGGNSQPFNTTTFTNIPDGTFLPVIVSNVWNTIEGDPATTCSGIVALY